MSFLESPLILALDVDDRSKAIQLAGLLKSEVGCFKVGPRLIQRYGAEIIQDLSRLRPVFVDCKYHDIPSTMDAAVRASFQAGASLVTVHASAGPEALQLLAGTERELNKKRNFKLLAVTVLTSFSESNLPINWKKQSIQQHVKDLSKQVLDSGLTGLVCSALELESLRGSDHFLVVPGIRLNTDQKGDQSRSLGPTEAMGLGASALVVGRPILEAQDPLAAARLFAQIIAQG